MAYRLGDGPDAEDVTSEVLENALRYRASFAPARGAPDTWLLGIARRCVSHHLASRVAVADSPAPVQTGVKHYREKQSSDRAEQQRQDEGREQGSEVDLPGWKPPSSFSAP